MSASENSSTKCSGLLLRSSFAILAARTRDRFSTLSTAAFSTRCRGSNSSDIVHRPSFLRRLTPKSICVRHDPIPPPVIRADERRRLKAIRQEYNRDPNDYGVSAQEWPLV